MNKQTVGIIAGCTALVAIGGGAVAWTEAQTAVQLDADGQTRTVRTFGHTVADALASGDVTLTDHDSVVPSKDSAIQDGSRITISYGRPVTITLDGRKQVVWTTSPRLSDVLDKLGITDDVQLSVNRDATVPREGLQVTATTPKLVTLVVGGVPRKALSTSATVGELLDEQQVRLGPNDAVDPNEQTPVTEGMTVKVAQKSTREVTYNATLTHQTVTTLDPNLAAGTTKVTRKGVDGKVIITFRLTVVDNTVVKKEMVRQQPVSKQVDEMISVGTKGTTPSSAPSGASPASPGAPTAAPAPGTSKSGVQLDTSRTAMWDKIAQCESSGNWSINTGNGYYGGLQFNIPTWQSVHGTDFAPRPDLATKEEQITAANRLYAQRGLQPWECGWAASR